jgi:hypothetical protein
MQRFKKFKRGSGAESERNDISMYDTIGVNDRLEEERHGGFVVSDKDRKFVSAFLPFNRREEEGDGELFEREVS